jgi:hypothetical protein
MTIRRRASMHLLALLFVVSLAASASALDPECFIKAASSVDGRTLVISEMQLEPMKDHPQAHRIAQITFQIFPQGNFQNYRFAAPITAWTYSALWRVVLSSEIDHLRLGCLIPMVSDGADYLVLLNNIDGVDPRNTVMLVYKAPSRSEPNRELWGLGVLVKQLTVRDLWPERFFLEMFPEQLFVGEPITSGTPAWFDGASFEWGKNNHSLVYKTSSGDVTHIDLDTGTVRKDAH